MAGRGPAPKVSRSRARDTPVRESVKSDGKIGGFELPPAEDVLPKYNNQAAEDWHPMTRQWWDAWRRSPQGVQMVTEVDWHYLLDTAMMHHQMWVSGNFERAAEVRIRVANFGATPADRLRLKMEIEIPEKYPVGTHGNANVTPIADRRQKLAGS